MQSVQIMLLSAFLMTCSMFQNYKASFNQSRFYGCEPEDLMLWFCVNFFFIFSASTACSGCNVCNILLITVYDAKLYNSGIDIWQLRTLCFPDICKLRMAEVL